MQLKASLVGLLLLRAMGVSAEAAASSDPITSDDPAAAAAAAAAAAPPVPAPPLSASIKTTFPDSEAIFGVKLINEHATRAVVAVTNNEAKPVDISFIGGSLVDAAAADAADADPSLTPPAALRNLTATRYDATIQPGETSEVTYSFALDMNPRDVRLVLWAVLMRADGQISQLEAYNAVATIVEGPTNIFDPQIIFLYLILSGLFGGALYLIYKTWLQSLFPQTRQRPAQAVTLRKSGRKNVDIVEPLSGSDDGGAATGTPGVGSDFDQSWIPDHNINRPVARRVKSGASGKGKAKMYVE